MSNAAGGEGVLADGGADGQARCYKRDFWSAENLKFTEPHFRLVKSARLVSRLAGGRECSLLDVGCGPATLQRLLPRTIQYHGIDIAIHHPAPNLVEADFLESPISFGGKRFDIVLAQGVFEYAAGLQSQKFAEIAALLKDDGVFIASYVNFGHRNRERYWLYNNVQPLPSFRDDLAAHFTIERRFPTSHNWNHSEPNRKLLQALNMRLNINIPLISPLLAVEYFFVCSPRR